MTTSTAVKTEEQELSWVRILRRLILATIAIGAATAIFALLGAEAEPLWKITGTSFLITGAALVSLPSAAAWERQKLGWLPIAGIAAAISGFGIAIYAIWVEPSKTVLWKLPVTLIIIGVGIAAISLLEFARLNERQQWVLAAARVLLGVVGTMLIAALWSEIEGGGYWRSFGIAAVLLTAFLASIPILHRSSRGADVAEFCPMCGSPSESRVGEQTVCTSCNRRYRVIS